MVLWLSTFALAPAAYAQRVALVIGNAAYEVKPLRNPVNDAQDVAAELRRAGFTVKFHTNLDRRSLNEAMRHFTSQAQSAQLAVLYYSGHGMQSAGENYIIPTDARINDEKDIRSEGLALKDILGDLEDARVQKTVVILDACRDNPYQTRTKSGKRGLARVETAGNATVVAFATADGQTADDGTGRNGVYTAALLGQLRQSGQDIRDLLDETANTVVRQTKAQKPKIYGDTGAFRGVYLTGSEVQLASLRAEPTSQRVQSDPEDDAWQVTKSTNSATGYEAYLNEYPKGRYAGAARVAIAAVRATPILQPQSVTARATERTELVTRDCSDCPEMVLLPAGSFQMGSNEDSDGKPTHRVNMKSFFLGKFEVTQGQWKAMMGSNPSKFSNCGDNCPVEQVSWIDIQQFIQKLNKKTGQNYRLPSEAEWEYAARAGSTTQYSWGNDIGRNNANCNGCGSEWDNKSTAPVGQFKPNSFGLHDTHGNVWEWVQDGNHDNYHAAPTDGSAWESGGDEKRRVLRGGSWYIIPANLRSALRFRLSPDLRDGGIGFRLARTAP